MKRPLLWALGGMVCAILLVAWQAPMVVCFLIPTLLLPLPFVFREIRWGSIFFVTLFYFAGLYSAALVWRTETVASTFDSKQVSVIGTVESIPVEKTRTTSWVLKIASVNGQPISGKVMMTCAHYNETLQTPAPGTVIHAVGEISQAEKKRNPGGFNYNTYLKAQGIAGLMYVKEPAQLTEGGRQHGFLYTLANWRIHMTQVCDQNFGADQSALIRGILFGDKTIESDVKTLFTDAGISHIMAVSGLHVGYLYAFIIAILGCLKIRDARQLAVLLPCLFFYTALTGFSASVIRASMMLMALVFGKVTKRHYDAFSGLCLAAVLILLISPAQLFAAGFQLSFGAVLGIVLFNRPLLTQYTRKIGNPGRIIQALVLTVCAMIGTLPFTLYHFQTVNLVAFAANVVVVPLVGLLLIMAFISVPLMAAFPFLARTLAFLPNALATVVLWLTKIFSTFKMLNFHRGGLNVLEAVFIALIAFWAAGYFNPHHFKQQIAIWSVLPLLIVGLVVMNLWPKDLTVTFLDVGQGDSILIQTPKGGNYLIDGGGYRRYGETSVSDKTPISEKVLLPALYSKGITHLDGVFISHNHEDHAQGIEELLTEMPVDKIYISTKYNGNALEKQQKIPVVTLSRGSTLRTEDGVRMDVLWPTEETQQVPDDEQNEASLVIRLSYGKRAFLFTGDAGLETEPQLNANLIQCDVVKIGHHGSSSATSPAFLRNASPVAAVISVGQHNTFGHPTQEVLETIDNSQATCYRTDQEGAVEIRTNGEQLWVHTYLGGNQ